MNWTKFISWLSAGFVFLLTVVSIILTYNALYDVAYDNGLTGSMGIVGLAYIWPLTIDGALLVFSLAVINASLLSDNTKPRWVMVGAFIALTIAFNFVDGGTDRLPDFVGYSLPFVVRMVPPISLALSFETLMSMLRKSIKRDNIVKSLANLENEWQTERSKFEAKKQQHDNELDNLTRQLEQAKHDLGQVKTEQKQANQSQLFKYIPDNLSPEIRQQFVGKMIQSGETIPTMAGYLGVSEGTIKNDKKAILSANGNG